MRSAPAACYDAPVPSASLTDLIAEFDELVLEGRAPAPEAYCAQHPEFPQLLPRLNELQKLHRALDRVFDQPRYRAEDPTLPALDGFRVIRPLGRGGMGRVYLAEQLS